MCSEHDKFLNKEPWDSKTFVQRAPDDSLLEPLGKSYSKTNLARLVSSVEDKSQGLSSFVGAGTSKPLGISDWAGLIQKLLIEKQSYFKDEYQDFIDARLSDDWDKVLSKYGHKFPKIASEIRDKFASEDEFVEWILREMKATSAECTSTLIQLALAVKTHLTTNFDRSLEAAYRLIYQIQRNKLGNADPKIHYYDRIYENPSDITPDIYYLHADLDRKFIILCEEEYEKLYEGEKVFQTFLSHHFANHSVIFVGFSFQDRHVDKCVTEAINQAVNFKESLTAVRTTTTPENRLQSHFLLTSTSNAYWIKEFEIEERKIEESRRNGISAKLEESERMGTFFKDFERKGIYPIVYNAHTYIEELFEYVDKSRNAGEW